MGMTPAFTAGVAQDEGVRQRKQELADEQRKTTLKTLLDDATTPQDKLSAIQAVYHQDPGVLKQHVENMTRKLTGKPSQPVVSPQQAQQARIGQLAPGKTPDQQALDQQKALAAQQLPQLAATGKVQNQTQSDADQQKQQSTLALIDKYITDPEQNKAAKQEFVQKQAGIFGQPKPLTGAAGQPVEFPPGSGLYARAVTNPDSTTAMVPMPEGWRPPAPKPPTSPAGIYANLLTKKILADGKQGPPLTPEESARLQANLSAMDAAGIARMRALAQYQAQYHLTTATIDGQEVQVPVSQGIAAAQAGQPLLAGVVGAPTAHDKQTQQYAVSGLHRLQEMRQIVKAHPEIFGPVGGRTTKASVWLGSQSPDAQKFLNDSQFLAEHSTAVFGGRAASTVAALQKIQSDPNTNPEALLAGFDSDESTLRDFTTGGGRLPEPKNLAPKKSTMSDDDFLLKVK